jgi:CheY-like chemotaxis protein
MNEHTEKINSYIGKCLREKRHTIGVSLITLADQIGVSFQQIHNYESGRSKISAAHLYQCAQTMEVDIDYFFKGLKTLKKCVQSTSDRIIQQDRSYDLNVLLIEDDDACVYLTRKAFESYSREVSLNVMSDYDSVFLFLRTQTPSLPFSRPDIIILDLNLPKVDGISILREIKHDKDLADIPVIILTNNTNAKDMITCYQEHASGYMCKPFDFDVFQTNINILAQYWAQTVVLPNRQCDVVYKSA